MNMNTKRKENTNGKVDVIIPAYKAHATIIRTLSSICMQSIRDDLYVIIVDDACPNDGKNNSYEKILDKFISLGLSGKVVHLL